MVLANPWPSLFLQRWAERCPARGLGTLDVMALRQFLRVILPPFDARDEGRLRRWDRERKPNRQTERRGGRRDKEASSYAHAEATRFALRFANSLFNGMPPEITAAEGSLRRARRGRNSSRRCRTLGSGRREIRRSPCRLRPAARATF